MWDHPNAITPHAEFWIIIVVDSIADVRPHMLISTLIWLGCIPSKQRRKERNCGSFNYWPWPRAISELHIVRYDILPTLEKMVDTVAMSPEGYWSTVCAYILSREGKRGIERETDQALTPSEWLYCRLAVFSSFVFCWLGLTPVPPSSHPKRSVGSDGCVNGERLGFSIFWMMRGMCSCTYVQHER